MRAMNNVFLLVFLEWFDVTVGVVTSTIACTYGTGEECGLGSKGDLKMCPY